VPGRSRRGWSRTAPRCPRPPTARPPAAGRRPQARLARGPADSTTADRPLESGNSAGRISAAVLDHTADYGAGIYFDGSTLTVDDSHVFNNAASSGGGGIYNNSDGGGVTLDLAWVFGNVPDNCEPVGTIAGCFG
jgi:hypothetical protein